MVHGVVVVDNRGYRFLAAILLLTLFLAVPVGVRLTKASCGCDGDMFRIEQITSSQQTENERRIAEIASIMQRDLIAAQRNIIQIGG